MYLCASFKRYRYAEKYQGLIHYSSAGIVLIAGIVLVYISFFMSHDVTSNVLWYFGQSLVYVATVFGFALTFDTRVKDIINKYFNNKNGTQD